MLYTYCVFIFMSYSTILRSLLKIMAWYGLDEHDFIYKLIPSICVT